ncbi:MAG: TlpA disulfide reductase family protein [Sporichthyaceae bacterium]
MARWQPLIVCAAVLLAGGCGSTGGAVASGGDTGFVAGSGTVTILPATERGTPVELSGPLLGGGRFDLANTRGRVVLVNIWGSWCAPCRKEAPDLQRAWTDLRPEGVQFLGVNTRDDAAGAAEAFERRFGITYPSVRDPDGALQLGFRRTLPPKAIPSTLVLDRDGRVAARIIGAGSYRTFVALARQIGAEPYRGAVPTTGPTRASR